MVPTLWTAPMSAVACWNDGWSVAATSEIENGADEFKVMATAAAHAELPVGLKWKYV